MGRKLTIDVTVRTTDNEHDVDGWGVIPAGTDEDEIVEHLRVQLDESAFTEDRTEELGYLEVARQTAQADTDARQVDAEEVAATPYDEKNQRPAFSEADAAAQYADDPAMEAGPAPAPSVGAVPREGVEETILANTDLSDEAAAALAESVPSAEDAQPVVVTDPDGGDVEVDVPNPSNPGTTPIVTGDDPSGPDLSNDPTLNEAPNPDTENGGTADADASDGTSTPAAPPEVAPPVVPESPGGDPTPVDVSGQLPDPSADVEPPVVVPPELIPSDPDTTGVPASDIPPEGLPDPALDNGPGPIGDAQPTSGPTKPLYVFDGDPADVAPPWTPTGQTNFDGRALFTFEPDVAGGEATGDGAGGVWHAVATLPGTPPADPATPPQEPAAVPPELDGSNAAPAPDGTAQEATEPVSEPATGDEGPDLTEPPADVAVPTEEQDPGQVATGGQVVAVEPAADATTVGE